MRLAILGGGGVRMPDFVHAMLSGEQAPFEEIVLFEPDGLRRATTARLAAEIAAVLGHGDVVRVSAEAEEAFSGADFVFSAIRVGGDAGRVIDEQVALVVGLVGQETTGPGGCAMALRTIPVVLGYCEVLRRVARAPRSSTSPTPPASSPRRSPRTEECVPWVSATRRAARSSA